MANKPPCPEARDGLLALCASRLRTRAHAESGITLIELMVAMVTSVIVIGGFFILLDSLTRSSANDLERSNSLVEQTAALHRITQELDETYQLNYPTEAGEYNYVDVDAWLTKPGASQ